MHGMPFGWTITFYAMSCLASRFDAMSGVKMLTNIDSAIYCAASAFEASDIVFIIKEHV